MSRVKNLGYATISLVTVLTSPFVKSAELWKALPRHQTDRVDHVESVVANAFSQK